MYVLTNQQMRTADEYTMSQGVPSLLFMERAGIALADEVQKLKKEGKIICVCGGGNNGGDGFVCARVLKMRGIEVGVVFYAEKTSADCRVNLEKWQALGGEILTQIPQDACLIVDCLYGTGFRGSLLDADMVTVEEINKLGKQGVFVVSADIPSGVNGDNGRVGNIAVQATLTVCIGEIKTGVLLGDGIDYSGIVKRVDIGIQLPEKEEYAYFIDQAWANRMLPQRKRNSHKGTFGKAAIVAGSIEYTGAAYLATAACLRSGAGYTTLFIPEGLLSYYLLKSPEALLRTTNEGDRYAFNKQRMEELLSYDSIAYGMGMGISEEVALGAVWLIDNYEGKLILDADGLNSLAVYRKEELSKIFQNKKCDVLLTPHGKEFAKLLGVSLDEILYEGFSASKALAKRWGVNILLKNATSVITDGDRTALNSAGCSGQAKGGTGDVLSGVIAGLCAMGLCTYEAGGLGAYICGKSAELVSELEGEYSLTASDIIAYLGAAFLFVAEYTDTECND